MRLTTAAGITAFGASAYLAGAAVAVAGSAGPLVLSSQILGGLAAAVAGFYLLLESAQPDSEVRDTFSYETENR
jgi:hypothetical protein